MLNFRRSFIVVLAALLFLVLFASAVSAQSVPAEDEPKWVFYERPVNLVVVVVDYEEAVRLITDESDYTLYDEMTSRMLSALANFRNVWIETKGGFVLHYSAAIDAGLTYEEAVNNPAFSASRPEASLEMYINPTTGFIDYRTPQAFDYPDWLVEIQPGEYSQATWEFASGKWIIDIFINPDGLPIKTGLLTYTPSEINAATIFGVTAVPNSTKTRWRITMDGVDGTETPPAVGVGDVRIQLGGIWYQ